MRRIQQRNTHATANRTVSTLFLQHTSGPHILNLPVGEWSTPERYRNAITALHTSSKGQHIRATLLRSIVNMLINLALYIFPTSGTCGQWLLY